MVKESQLQSAASTGTLACGLRRMQRILECYWNEILGQHPRNFALLAEGPLEQIRQLQAQIDDYFRQLETAETPGNR